MHRTIGIPQALASYYFYPLWKTFFTELGFDVITSGPTDRKKLNQGIQLAPSEACLPLKCYLGHVAALAETVEAIFVPRLVCLQKHPRVKLGCPKFIGLPFTMVFDAKANIPSMIRMPDNVNQTFVFPITFSILASLIKHL